MICPVCGRLFNVTEGQIAHRIPQSKGNLKRYGTAVIHNPANLVDVCRWYGNRCNDSVSLSNHPRDAAALLVRIYRTLAKEIDNGSSL